MQVQPKSNFKAAIVPLSYHTLSLSSVPHDNENISRCKEPHGQHTKEHGRGTAGNLRDCSAENFEVLSREVANCHKRRRISKG